MTDHENIELQETLEKDHYDSVWANREQNTAESNLPQYLTQQKRLALIPVFEHLYQRTKRLQGNKVQAALDIGCGLGRNSALIADIGFHVDAIDISESAINNAAKLNPNPNTKYSNISVFQIENKKKRYLGILDDGFFHHVRPNCRRPYLRKVRELLDPRFGLFVLVYLADCEENQVLGNYNSDPTSAHFTKLYQPEDVQELADEFGLIARELLTDTDNSGREFYIHVFGMCQ